jgi:hypothetical protein
MRKGLIPMEAYIAILAAFTVPLSVYTKLPMWATYVTWAGAFLVAPNFEGIKKLFPTLTLGTISGVVFFVLAFTLDPLTGSVALTNSLIVFTMTLTLLYVARIPAFALIPGIFFGFSCFVAVVIAAQVNTISGLFAPWLYATITLLLGPPLAWLSVAPYVPREIQGGVPRVAVPAAENVPASS